MRKLIFSRERLRDALLVAIQFPGEITVEYENAGDANSGAAYIVDALLNGSKARSPVGDPAAMEAFNELQGHAIRLIQEEFIPFDSSMSLDLRNLLEIARLPCGFTKGMQIPGDREYLYTLADLGVVHGFVWLGAFLLADHDSVTLSEWTLLDLEMRDRDLVIRSLLVAIEREIVDYSLFAFPQRMAQICEMARWLQNSREVQDELIPKLLSAICPGQLWHRHGAWQSLTTLCQIWPGAAFHLGQTLQAPPDPSSIEIHIWAKGIAYALLSREYDNSNWTLLTSSLKEGAKKLKGVERYLFSAFAGTPTNCDGITVYDILQFLAEQRPLLPAKNAAKTGAEIPVETAVR